MAVLMRIRVAPYAESWLQGESNLAGPYLVDQQIDVVRETFLFGSTQEVLNAADQAGAYRQAHRRSELYVRPTAIPASTATLHDYHAVNEIWAVDERGALFAWSFFDRRDLPVRDVLRATLDGYNHLDFLDVIIASPAGRGGDTTAFSWIEFFGGLGLGLATNIVWVTATRALARMGIIVRTKREDAEIARIAAMWVSRGISSSFRLRRWLEIKEQWSAVEVAQRLSLETEPALRLLVALGYEPLVDDPDAFVLGTGKRAKGRRSRWLKQETDSQIFGAW